MRKRWLVMGLTVLTATSLSMTACGKKEEAQPIDTYTDNTNYATQEENVVDSSEIYTETTAEITEAAVESSDGLVKISDIKDDALSRSVTQAQNGFKQLCISAGMTNVSVDILHNREALFEALGITEEELLKLTTDDELIPYLEEKGLTSEQILCFSIYNYLLQALDNGDESDIESMQNYLTKTKELLANNDLDFDVMINTKNFSELVSYIQSNGMDVEDLNNKLWVNSIFPGLDVDATALMNASTPYEFLKVFSETELTLDQIAERAAEPDKAAELLTTLNRIEEESIAEESSKNAGNNSGGSSSGSGSGSGGKTASDIKESLENKEAETIPDKGGANSVTLLVGNDGSGATSNKPNSSNSDSKGNATIKVNDKDEKVRIIVRRIVRGDKAVSEINASNSNLPGMVDVENIPDDYDWVAVKFTVRRADSDSNTGNSDDLVRPLVRVKNMSGANIEDVATRVLYIDPDTSAENSDSVTYWVAFMLPEDQANFMLYFGETSGTVYKFKSTALMEDDDD